MMKILYISSDLGIPILGGKGAAIHVRSLANALTRAGHEVVVTSPVLNKSPWERPAQIDAMVLHIPPSDEAKEAALTLKTYNASIDGDAHSLPGEIRRILYNEALHRRLARKFGSHTPDFIYERASLYGTAGVTIARHLGRPLIVELNAPLATEQSIYRGSGLGDLAAHAERWMLQRADAVVVVSASLGDYVASLGVAREQIVVLPNGVDAQLFRADTPDPSVRRAWQLGEGPVLGFVGGLRPWHGVEVLPDLLARLVPDFPDLRLAAVGDGPLRDKLQSKLDDYGLADRAILTGALPHEQVPALVRNFDVALAPYPKLEHSFYFSPLKLFEYMACGVPVVAPELGQITEVVRHEETGLLYAADDVDAMTASCRRLLHDVGLRRKLGQTASQTVAQRYTWDGNARQVVDLARQLGAGNGRLK